MAREYKLKLDNKQARNIAVAYFCGIPAEILRVKFGVCPSLVYQCAVGKYSGTLEEDDLIKFYRGSGKENRDRNASNLHLNSRGFANVSSEVLPKNERFKVSGYDLANQLIRNNILNPRIDEIATETSFRYLASLKGGYEILLAKVFGVLDPDMKIIELEFDRTLIGAYQSGDISLEQVTDVTKRHVAEKIRQGALTITPKKREAINQTLETLTDREREVLDVRFDLSGRYSSGRTLEESGKILGRSSQMVRQIEYGALRRLRHPIRVRQLKFVYGLVTDDEASYKIEEARRNESERINKFRNEAERVIREGDLDKLSVDEFEFSVRTANCLNNVGIATVGQLVKKTECDMLKCRNFGRKSLEEIKTRLQEIGIDWPGYMSTERKNESPEDIQEIVSKGDLDRISVNEIEFSVRVANCLNNVGIATVGQLVKKTECDMLKCRNFGRKSLEEIKTRLQEIGIDWSDYRQKSYKIKKCQKR